jgi:mRNA-degrading endonuclease HigB of HigAB toxin-antitoxin module
MEYGIRALLVLLRNYIRKDFNTIEKIIKRYAPSNENDTEAYIRAVSNTSGYDANMILEFTFEDMLPLIKAISKHENGGEYITTEQIRKAWEAI